MYEHFLIRLDYSFIFLSVFFFFFSSRRRHTRFDCDWSSDVCSSDLPPMILRSFVVRGLDSVPERGRIVRDLPVREGGRFDRFAIDAAGDTVRQRLHNNGYPRGEADNRFIVNDSALSAWDTLYVTPGPRT